MDGPASNSHGTGIVPLVRIRARSRGEGGVQAAAEAFRNILNRCDKGWMGTRADVSGRVYLLPCHCQVPLCGESWGRRGRWWVTRRPGARDSGGPAWAPRGGLAARSTRGGRGQSRAPGQLLSCSRLPCRGAARRGPWGWAGPDRACWDVALRLGLFLSFVLSCRCWAPRARRGKSKSAA